MVRMGRSCKRSHRALREIQERSGSDLEKIYKSARRPDGAWRSPKVVWKIARKGLGKIWKVRQRRFGKGLEVLGGITWKTPSKKFH